MKTITLLLSLAFLTSGFAQTFQWDTNDTIQTNLDLNTTVQLPIYQSAIGNDTVTLGIEIIHNDLPQSWDGMVCIHGACLGTIPVVGTQATMAPISGSTQGMVRLTVNPLNGNETAKLQIYVFDVDFPNDGDTATWLLNTTLGIDEALANNFTVSPNPTTDLINIDVESAIGTIKIIDAEGRVVLLDEAKETLSVADLPIGIYIIRIETSAGVLQNRFVKR